jgi:transposase-like protein
MKKGRVWRHPEAFQRMAVERFKCCENIEHLATELGVARQTLYRWDKKSEGADEGQDAVLEKSRESRLRREIRDLKRLLAEKVLEVDFFKGALQQIESHDRKNSGSGRPTFTSTSGA